MNTELVIAIVGIPTALIPVIMFALKQWAKTQKELQAERDLTRTKLMKEQGDQIRDLGFAAKDLSVQIVTLQGDLKTSRADLTKYQENFNNFVRILRSYVEKNEIRHARHEGEIVKLGKLGAFIVKGSKP